MSFAENLFDEYVVQGGVTMLALVPLSIFTFGLIIQRSLELRQSKVISAEVIAAAKKVKNQQSFNEFVAFLNKNPSPLANILLGYIDLGERGESIDPKENLIPVDDEAEQLYHSISQISTSYIVAPLIGVLGTTVGIMATFKQFAVTGKRDMAALVSAIDKSLITTMWGLLIAVPAYFFYALLQSKIFKYERKALPKIAGEIMPQLAPYIRPRKS